MAKTLVNIFSQEAYAGGGSYFNDGLYRIEEARFVKFDFNGSAPGENGDGLVCLCCKLQPLDKDGGDVGEVAVQYWSVGDKTVIENKGHAISLSGDFATIWNLCDFAVFIDYLGKAGFDRDAMEQENDIAVLDGTVAEFGKVPSPRQSTKAKGDDEGGKKKKYPAQVIVVTAIPDTKVKGSSKKSTSAKPTSSKKEESSSDDDETNIEILQQYLVKEVLVKKNEGGIDRLQARMNLNKFVLGLGGDSDKVKAVSDVFKDTAKLKEILKSADWQLDGTTIKPKE